MFHNDTGISGDKDRANLFNDYFYSVFTSSSSLLPEIWELPSCPNPLHAISIDEQDVYCVLTNLDVNKATGIDTIGPKILKHCAISLLQPIHYLFNLTLSNSMIPSEWKVHQI